MFDSSFEDRLSSFHLAPGAFMLIRWAVGTAYVYYLVLFILVLQDVVRPSLLWLIPSINNPEFDPLKVYI